MAYGKHLILDMYGCDASKFTRESIKVWLEELCKMIDMEREDLHFWDYDKTAEDPYPVPPHLSGTSAVQFITTSNIVIHTLDLIGEAYIDLFSCKTFDEKKAVEFTAKFFGVAAYEAKVVMRGVGSECKRNVVS